MDRLKETRLGTITAQNVKVITLQAMRIFSSHNTVVAENSKIRLYYGPSEFEEFMFTVSKNGKVVFSLSNSQLLDISDGEKPKDVFLAGVVAYLGR